MEGRDGSLHDPFDAHALASILAMAIAEAKGGIALSEATGLNLVTVESLMSAVFPRAHGLNLPHGDRTEPSIPEDESCLRELLMRSTTHRTQFQLRLAALVARRAMRPNHLWQDCGLRNRNELCDLMSRHFAPIATRNVNNMKWKKFLYRMICRDEGFRLCTAPSCAECDDFSVCFGDESGESFLARSRRQAELYAIAAAPI